MLEISANKPRVSFVLEIFDCRLENLRVMTSIRLGSEKSEVGFLITKSGFCSFHPSAINLLRDSNPIDVLSQTSNISRTNNRFEVERQEEKKT